MKTTTAVGITAAALLAYSLLRKQAGFATIIFSPEKPHGFQFEGMQPVITLGIRAQNTSNQNFVIRSMAANVYSVEDSALEQVGNVSSFITQIIPANGQVILMVKVYLRLIGVANEIIEAVQNKDFEKKILLKGLANVDNLQLPFELQFTVGI